MRSDVQLADEGIYFLSSLHDLRDQCAELDSISFNESDWKGPGHYQFEFDEGRASFLGARCSACGHFEVDPEGCEACARD